MGSHGKKQGRAPFQDWAVGLKAGNGTCRSRTRWSNSEGLPPAQSQERQAPAAPHPSPLPELPSAHPEGCTQESGGVGRQHRDGCLRGLLASPRPWSTGEWAAPWQCLAVEAVKSKAKVPRGTRGPGGASLLEGACLCLDACFSHTRCPPGGLASPGKPRRLLLPTALPAQDTSAHARSLNVRPGPCLPHPDSPGPLPSP